MQYGHKKYHRRCINKTNKEKTDRLYILTTQEQELWFGKILIERDMFELRHTQQYGGYQKARRWGRMKQMKGIKYMEMEGDQTLGGEYTMQYTDDYYRIEYLKLM